MNNPDMKQLMHLKRLEKAHAKYITGLSLIVQLRDQVDALAAQNELLLQRIAAMEASKSWKWTRFLRKYFGFLR